MRFGILVLRLTFFVVASIGDNSFFVSAKRKRENEEVLPISEELLNRYIIKFDSKESYTSFTQISNSDIVGKIPQLNVVGLKFDSEELAQEWASGRDDIKYVEKDILVHANQEETPYGIDLVNAYSIPGYVEDSGIKMCILDTGYDLGHEDLPNSNNGDPVSGNTDSLCSDDPCDWYEDPHGHGTHVAGTIAATGNNDIGVIGVVGTNRMPLRINRVLNSMGTGTTMQIVQGMYDCHDERANVVNMSLGYTGGVAPQQFFQEAVDDILSKNDKILFVAAAGNAGTTQYNWPASMPEFMSVAAVFENKHWVYFSQFNDRVDIAAPGFDVLSTYPENDYRQLKGTSMAAPHVAGVAAKIWSHKPSMTAQEVRDLLEKTAEDRGIKGRDDYYGHGLVDALAAYEDLTANCEDSPAIFLWKEKKRTCQRVAEMNPSLCNYYEVSISCPKTCEACGMYRCSDAVLPFYIEKDGDEWTCQKLYMSESKEDLCAEYASFYHTCRATCMKCSDDSNQLSTS